MTPTTCRSCGAPMLWLKTDNDKSMPVDAEPTGKALVRYGRDGERCRFVHTYTSHWATCPNAATHRKEAP